MSGGFPKVNGDLLTRLKVGQVDDVQEGCVYRLECGGILTQALELGREKLELSPLQTGLGSLLARGCRLLDLNGLVSSRRIQWSESTKITFECRECVLNAQQTPMLQSQGFAIPGVRAGRLRNAGC